MNDMPTTPDSTPQPNPAAAPSNGVNSNSDTPSSKNAGTGRQRLIYLALVILAGLLAAQWWVSREELSTVRTEVARRIQSGDAINTETKVIVKAAQETVTELQAKVNVLESKQVEAQSQQLALEQLYQDLFKKRDDWALAEIEQVLSTASQQLQLAGNVQGALIALQNADARLSRADSPQFVNVRRAIGHDIARLKALPSLDLTGIALRLDSVIGQIDTMPLLSDEQPALPASEPKNRPVPVKPHAKNAKATAAEEAAPANDWWPVAKAKWESVSSEMWGEIQQLIRVRSVDTSDALLLSPTQAYYARENLKLRLLNARLALLSRNESAFRSDMIASQDSISKYFDTRAKQTQTVQAMLKQVQSSNLAIEMPTLAESLNAVRNFKAKP
ncbi:uroporphyrinogen-III C-methyltransferase [Herminiimonas arsenitoxidans]|uniref:uroporphyrinogen-III C-methyltransferase n=1 Tax=Herminiimonas arsenitoxidans TaxID=1809410 RepID=UPI0009708A9E|nr:uroporphyrinogen-III C-methyltransferase [Herminiimonas arsenitoxidans]